jgi:predicted enzyme related to lactoylglutathione lyase
MALIPCKDMQGVRKFYEDVLGFSAARETPAGIEYRAGDHGFILYPTQFAGIAQHTLMGWVVDDIEATIDELSAKGVTFEQYDFPGLKTNEKGIAELEGELSAWFKDPEGNILGLFQYA